MFFGISRQVKRFYLANTEKHWDGCPKQSWRSLSDSQKDSWSIAYLREARNVANITQHFH